MLCLQHLPVTDACHLAAPQSCQWWQNLAPGACPACSTPSDASLPVAMRGQQGHSKLGEAVCGNSKAGHHCSWCAPKVLHAFQKQWCYLLYTKAHLLLAAHSRRSFGGAAAHRSVVPWTCAPLVHLAGRQAHPPPSAQKRSAMPLRLVARAVWPSVVAPAAPLLRVMPDAGVLVLWLWSAQRCI